MEIQLSVANGYTNQQVRDLIIESCSHPVTPVQTTSTVAFTTTSTRMLFSVFGRSSMCWVLNYFLILTQNEVKVIYDW